MQKALRITVPGGNDEQLASLYRWLAESPRVAAAAELTLDTSTRPGDMGERLERINVIVSNSLAALSLVVASMALWQGDEPGPEPPPIRIETDDVTIVITNPDADEISRVVAELMAESGESRENAENSEDEGAGHHSGEAP